MSTITLRLPDSGNMITLRRLAPHTIDYVMTAARQELSSEKPHPPLNTNPEIGTVNEPDYQDRGYRAALQLHDAKVHERFNTLMLQLIAKRCQFEVDRAALDEYRAELADLGIPLPGDDDDHETYLYHILCETKRDTNYIVEVATGQSKPDEEAVQAHVEAFPSHVQGA